MDGLKKSDSRFGRGRLGNRRSRERASSFVLSQF
jgi:hypothetical protein